MSVDTNLTHLIDDLMHAHEFFLSHAVPGEFSVIAAQADERRSEIARQLAPKLQSLGEDGVEHAGYNWSSPDGRGISRRPLPVEVP